MEESPFISLSPVILLKDSEGKVVLLFFFFFDDLQAAMAVIRKDVADLPLSFNNFRD